MHIIVRQQALNYLQKLDKGIDTKPEIGFCYYPPENTWIAFKGFDIEYKDSQKEALQFITKQ